LVALIVASGSGLRCRELSKANGVLKMIGRGVVDGGEMGV